MSRLTIYSDGAARGNPGPSGAGWVLLNEKGKLLTENCQFLGHLTNNQAEYRALLLALKEAKKMGGKEIAVFSDSELMVRQLNKEYKVKNEGLRPLFEETLLTLSQFQSYTITHIDREKNEEADQLANQAIDEAL